ncbi:hypothetical protein Y1Q_0009211 [Alligator mississippiensis]|uniref:Uncharacterized protein n=1 Tax=Alligator mississippiensis TaxID=8496 RepID=A0A151M2S5_ALLMI|nr:hypothetical protein Y1Q_0009211 [Alligator mississippiensis]
MGCSCESRWNKSTRTSNASQDGHWWMLADELEETATSSKRFTEGEFWKKYDEGCRRCAPREAVTFANTSLSRNPEANKICD